MKRLYAGGWEVVLDMRWLLITLFCLLAMGRPAVAVVARFPIDMPPGEGVLTAEEKVTAAKFSPRLPEIINSKTDVWGREAMRQPDGASYEFFEKLLPPIRYCNAEFKYYPIVLSAPASLCKARFVSNGSAVNARANLERWKEVGFPVTFRIHGGEVFGEDLHRLEGPHYAEGYLPIVDLTYRKGAARYHEEAFAATPSPFAEHGVVFVRFNAEGTNDGEITAAVGADEPLNLKDGTLCSSDGRVFVVVGSGWKWDAAGRSLTATLKPGTSAVLAIAAKPFAYGQKPLPDYDEQRKECEKTWNAILDRAMQVQTPEQLVNNAWRAVIIGTLMLVRGNLMCYSASNQYEKIYVHEGGDAVKALMLWGCFDDARPTMLPLLDYEREGLRFHETGLKLQMISLYYWLTHDSEFVKAQRNRWSTQVERIIEGREPKSGLFPKERYCTDIGEPVYSLNTNSNAWRGLRDFAVVLNRIGERDEAAKLAKIAREFRPAILAAAEKSIRHDTKPPFIPIALFGQEQPYEQMTAMRIGGYYDLVCPLAMGSGIFGAYSKETGWMLDYIDQHGGVCMGLVRTRPQNVMYTVKQGINDLYTTPYVLALLQRDEVERALVSFYGKLAEGFTRDTFIGGEAAAFVPWDEFGRPTYMPPNSASNAFFLTMLRNLMVQDWDTDDDGSPDTLRLMFATPRRWLGDGKTVKVDRAPTPFGPVSVSVHSHLKKGEVLAEVSAPEGTPQKTLLRIRLPEGWKVTAARCGATLLSVDKQGTVDVSAMKAKYTVHCAVTAKQ